MYLTQPFFQDGIIAQSANNVAKERGVPYFSSAGNSAQQSWEGTFLGSGLFDRKGCELHNFSTDGTVQTRQNVFLTDAAFTFQWDDPFFSVSGGAGATRDMDFRIFDAITGELIVDANGDNVGGDAFEFIAFSAQVLLNSNLPYALRPYSLYEMGRIWNCIATLSTIHSLQLHGVIKIGQFTAGVGAAFFLNTPEFGLRSSSSGEFLESWRYPHYFRSFWS